MNLFTEKNLEDIIYNTFHKENGSKLLEERGLKLKGTLYRQVDVKEYGIIDLLCIGILNGNTPECSFVFDVIELKQGLINRDGFYQAIRYAKAISIICANIGIEYDLRISLIGKSIDLGSDICYLPDIFKNVHFYTFNYDIDGITFHEQIEYKLSNSDKFDKMTNLAGVSFSDFLKFVKTEDNGETN